MMQVFGARVTPGDPKAVMAGVQTFKEGKDVLVQLFDARWVYGAIHLESAFTHAQRAVDNNLAISSGMETEILLYAAGERQIRVALEKVGLTQETNTVAGVIMGEVGGNDLITHMGWERDDTLLEGDEGILDRFGISQIERDTVGEKNWQKLVLERVAMVTLEK